MLKVFRSVCSAGIAAAIACSSAGVAVAQTSAGAAARVPDLSGIWSNGSITKLQRPDRAKNLVLTEAEAREFESNDFWNQNEITQRDTPDVTKAPPKGEGGAEFARTGYNSFWLDWGKHLAQVKGEFRTSYITWPENGKLPLKPGVVVNRPTTPGYGTFDSYETRPFAERCTLSFSRSSGPVLQNGIYNNNYQIVQAPSHVVVLSEMIHEARIIPLVANAAAAAGAHKNPVLAPNYGDSVGWYDGDALVVRTTHVPAGWGSLMSPTGVLIERFSRYSDNQILYEFSVDDPAFYTEAWRGEMSLNKTDEQIFEYSCHEGNQSFPGILAGARAKEKEGGSFGTVADSEE